MGWRDAPLVSSGGSWRDAPLVDAEPAPDTGTPFNAEALKDTVVATGKDLALGAVKGAANIGSTLLAPLDFARDKVRQIATGEVRNTNKDRRALTSQFMAENANPDSNAFAVGELGSEIAGTAGVGGTVAQGIRAIPWLAKTAPRLASAIESGGFTLGGTPATGVGGKAAEMALRATGGAVVGGASAGLVDPSNAPAGMAIGGALPVGVKAAGAAGKAVRQAIAKDVEPEVAALYQRAKDLGIEIPADRLTNSKPLNAVAASLDYLPFSGRAATEEKMVSQFNKAISRTFGQDSDNITGALRKADLDLGTKFERTLSSNKVALDNNFVGDMAGVVQKAANELSEGEAKIIAKQVEDIISKANVGMIDGQAAYNIKKTLDRIGNRQTNEAFYARELKKSLMAALERSLGPAKAAEFKTLRQQYGTMLDLESLAQNGAEGGISIGRLANMKGINNQELQELADIAAQFLKTRENPHGAAQRVVMGAALAATHDFTGILPAIAVGGGRASNMLLNSNSVKNAMLGRSQPGRNLLADPAMRALIYETNQGSP